MGTHSAIWEEQIWRFRRTEGILAKNMLDVTLSATNVMRYSQFIPGSILANVNKVESFATKHDENSSAASLPWRSANSFSKST